MAQNEAEAVRLYRFAADEGFRSAWINLGVMYFEGRGVSKSYSEAAIWFRKAVEHGDVHGMLNLGRTLWAQGKYADAYSWLSAAVMKLEGAARDAACRERDSVASLMSRADLAGAQERANNYTAK